MSDHTRTARERAEQLAVELFPSLRSPGNMMRRASFVEGFTRRDAEPTTVTAEQIEQAAMAINAHHEYFMPVWSDLVKSKDRANQNRVRRDREYAELALRAAGFRIQGDPA